MVWSLILALVFFLPSSAYAEPVTEVTPDVSVEQPSTPDDQPDLPVSEPDTSLTLYGDDGPVLSEEDLRVPAPEERKGLPSSVFESVTPNSSYASFASALLPKLPWGHDYVFFRSAENEYYFVSGDLSFDGSRFKGTGCDYVRFYYSGSSRGYLMGSGSGDLSLSVDGFVVLSSLGPFPTVSGSDALITGTFAFVASVALGCYVISRLLSFGLRTRVEVVSNAPTK